ncbi:unnamed protein product [Darwinula stevensoni]|uniref:Uncharacterized protein n=1 Tax=Darwinula stevensoni TaxID=69355 RepID=A0A7R8XCA7_9CRUS|nr:unnamed protein product [Darwinula stevensoni]CAG0893136.1 unnamed protein product [Darwinula stevensoni]
MWIFSLLLSVFLLGSSVDGQCGGFFTASSGSFWSPNYPSNYYNNAYCTYTISLPSGYYMYYEYVSFDLEQDEYCQFDSITVRCPATGWSETRCGYFDSLGPFYEAHNYLSFVFQTDGSVTRRGFLLDYWAYYAKCEEGWLEHDGACYLFANEPKTGSEAQLECEENWANLASVRSEEENAFIGENAPSSPVWIGLQKLDQKLRWADESRYEEATFHENFHFEDGFAYAGAEQRVDGDDSDEIRLPYVCKKYLGSVRDIPSN